MRMFFCAVRRRGRVAEREVETFRRQVASEVVCAEHLRHVDVIQPTPDSLLIGVSNEPRSGYSIGDKTLWPCGTFWDDSAFHTIAPGPHFALAISRLPGRFSAVLSQGRTFAIGTPVARVDSVFRADNDDFFFFGNQASVLSVLRDGRIRFAPEEMLSFICSGQYGTDGTPFAGVAAVPPLTTIYYDGERLRIESSPLSDVKDDARPPAEILDCCADSLGAAVRPLVDSTKPVRLGLTGGQDSRLVLAVCRSAGARLACHTLARGASNRADVWVARRVAERADVDHVVTDGSADDAAAPSGRTLDLLHQTAKTLHASDGMLGCQYPVRWSPSVFRSAISVGGLGGEMLRGGYAEKAPQPTVETVEQLFDRTWNHLPDLFEPSLAVEQRDRSRRWISGQLANVAPDETLDLAYVYFRCGRWVAASTRGVSTKFHPLLDNRVSREVLAIPAAYKRTHSLHRELIERLMPELADLPLANTFWHGTPKEERRRLRSRVPEAYSAAVARQAHLMPRLARSLRRLVGLSYGPTSRARPRPTLAPPVIDHIRAYVLDEGRLDALAGVLDLDRTARFLRDPPRTEIGQRGLSGVYSATVLLTENWRHSELPTSPIVLSPRAAV